MAWWQSDQRRQFGTKRGDGERRKHLGRWSDHQCIVQVQGLGGSGWLKGPVAGGIEKS